MRRDLVVTLVLVAAVSLAVAALLQGQTRSAGRGLIERAAEALGGADRILSIETLTIEGYGQLASQNGGGNVTGSPDAPQKWTHLYDVVRTIDLAHWRTRLSQRQAPGFVFAAARSMRGTASVQALDGDVAFNVTAAGTAVRAGEAAVYQRRMEMLSHPIAIVRAALHPGSRVGHRRSSDGLEIVDVTIPEGDTLTLAIDSESSRPAWVSWVGPDTSLGDLTYRTHFIGYQPVSGVLMPTAFTTTIDFRNLVRQTLHVDRHAVDSSFEDLEAPAAVRAAPVPEPQAPAIEVTEVARGIWFLQGAGNSTLFEFDDHLTIFELYASEANARAIIETARSIVPGKPLTEAIVSHHHFDHSGGLRAAVAEGLTVIAARGNEGILREIATRPARRFPDALARAPRPIALRLVDDHLKLRDGSMDIDVYRVIANGHMADALMVHVPRERLLVQGDLFDVAWDAYWWGSSYLDNVRHREIEVERDVPVHGRILPFTEVQAHIARQIEGARQLCQSADEAGFLVPGCPVKTTVDR